MDPTKKLFRQKSLDKISSPERLDELMQVTSPRLWIGLVTVGMLLGFALVWGIFGRIPMKVHGQGILLRSAGLFTMTSEGSGRVSTILVEPGDNIEAGQTIARLVSPDRERVIGETEQKVQRMSENHDKLVRFVNKDRMLRLESLDRQAERLNNSVASLERKAGFVKKQIEINEELLERGLLTSQELQQNQLDLAQVELQTEEAQVQLQGLELSRTEALNEADQKIAQSQVELDAERTRLVDLRQTYDRTSQITSPYPGRVLEILIDQHELISSGATILSLELKGAELTTQFFVPDTESTRVEAGMEIQISPSTVKKERYGVLLGEVESVSDFPATPLSMMSVLQNEELVQQMSSSGAQFAGVALLQKDPATYSGFAWSSAAGPEENLFTGTICEVSIITSENAPITLVIPFLRKFFGI